MTLPRDSENESEYIPFVNSIPAGQNIDNIPAPATRSQLPCPNYGGGCHIMYDLREKQKWILHSLDHFLPNPPPKAVTCIFPGCREPFCNSNGFLTWTRFMDHFADHYRIELEQFRDALDGFTDVTDEAQLLLSFTEDIGIDVNLSQYMIRHCETSPFGMNQHINPKPPSELDRIPVGYMNRMPPEYGGRRVREVVFGPVDNAEPNLDSRSAGVIQVSSRREGRRRREDTAVWVAKTSWGYNRPIYTSRVDRRTERIVIHS